MDCSNNEVPSPLVSGFLANFNQGVILSGTASANVPGGGGVGCAALVWSGSGSGTFNTDTLPVRWNFSISGPNLSIPGWIMLFFFNVNPFDENRAKSLMADTQSRIARRKRSTDRAAAADSLLCEPAGPIPGAALTICTCFGPSCVGSQTGTFPVAVPNNSPFQSYTVRLGAAANSIDASAHPLTITVPGSSSIDINVPLLSAAPAPSALVLTILGFGALALGRVFMKHRNTT